MRTSEFDSVQARIASLDLEPIKFKLVKEGYYSRDDVEALEKWYKRFLFLTFKHKDRPIVVSEAIDAFWHQHILDTRKYAEDCEFAFGEFLHHFPYFGLRGEEDQRALRAAHQSTLELMRAEFGDSPDEELRVLGTNAADPNLPSLCSDCGSIWPTEATPFGQQRPRLSDLVK